jgi:hypothetical protein
MLGFDAIAWFWRRLGERACAISRRAPNDDALI